MPDSRQEPRADEAIEMELRRPKSYVTSIRVSPDESRALTRAARRARMKLSTFIKAAALDAAESQLARAEPTFQLGGSTNTVKVYLTRGDSATHAQGASGEVRREPAPSWPREATA